MPTNVNRTTESANGLTWDVGQANQSLRDLGLPANPQNRKDLATGYAKDANGDKVLDAAEIKAGVDALVAGTKPQSGVQAAADSITTLLTVTEEDRAKGLAVLEAHSKAKQTASQKPGTRLKAASGNHEKGGWSRGFIQSEQMRPPGAAGSVFTVYGAHGYRDKNGTFDGWSNLCLRMKVGSRQIDVRFRPGIIRANFGDNPPAERYESTQKFWLSDAAIESAIKAQLPNLKDKSFDDLVSQSKFSVHAYWNGSSHQWGGFDRHGDFDFIKPDGKVAEVEANLVFGLPAGRADLDAVAPIPKRVVEKFPALFKGVEKPTMASHLEVEGKPQVSLTDFLRLYNLMNQVDGTAQEQQAFMKGAFGSEWQQWSGHRVKKYDPANVDQLDSHGMKQVHAFVDRYFDSEARGCTAQEAVFRIRTVKGEGQKKVAQINFKPGKGHPVGNNVSQRVEYELYVDAKVADDPDVLRAFFRDLNEQYNPWRAMHQATGIDGGTVTKPSSIGQNRRYKFEFEKTSGANQGVAFEASVDLCLTLPLDAKTGLPIRVDKDGNPNPRGHSFAMSTFGQLEPEANHMALNGPATTVTAPPDAANGKPTVFLHGPNDVTSPAFAADPSFNQFKSTWGQMQGFLFPSGTPPMGNQKNSAGQMLAGTSPMTAAQQKVYAEEMLATSMLRQSASAVLKPAFDQAFDDYDTAEATYKMETKAGTKNAHANFVAAKAKIGKAIRTALEQINPLDHIDMAALKKAMGNSPSGLSS